MSALQNPRYIIILTKAAQCLKGNDENSIFSTCSNQLSYSPKFDKISRRGRTRTYDHVRDRDAK